MCIKGARRQRRLYRCVRCAACHVSVDLVCVWPVPERATRLPGTGTPRRRGRARVPCAQTAAHSAARGARVRVCASSLTERVRLRVLG